MPIRRGALLLAVLLLLETLPAAGASAPAPERRLRAVSVSSSCAESAGRMELRLVDTKEGRLRVTARASGLPVGYDQAAIGRQDAEPATWDLDPSARGFEHRTSYGGRLTGRAVIAMASDREGMPGCSVSSFVDRTRVLVDAGSAELSVQVFGDLLTLAFTGVPCHGRTADGAIVAQVGQRTVRSRFDGARCRHGAVTFYREVARGTLPRSVTAVVRSDGGAWRMAYDLRFARTSR